MYHNIEQDVIQNSIEADFLGMGKKAAAKRQEKKADKREQKSVLKTDRINARQDAKTKRAEVRSNGGGGFFDKALKTVGNVLGKASDKVDTIDVSKDGVSAQMAGADELESQSKMTKYLPWIIGFIVLLAIIAFIVFKMKKP